MTPIFHCAINIGRETGSFQFGATISTRGLRVGFNRRWRLSRWQALLSLRPFTITIPLDEGLHVKRTSSHSATAFTIRVPVSEAPSRATNTSTKISALVSVAVLTITSLFDENLDPWSRSCPQSWPWQLRLKVSNFEEGHWRIRILLSERWHMTKKFSSLAVPYFLRKLPSSQTPLRRLFLLRRSAQSTSSKLAAAWRKMNNLEDFERSI